MAEPPPKRSIDTPHPNPSPEGEGPRAEPVLIPARKRRFLDELARHGNVRVAAARVGVSRSGVYLARGRDAAFAAAWRAALVLGRDRAVAEVAERALEGWQEPVFYRGQQVALRRRYDTRLLLAHLARLDKACAEMAGGGGSGAEALAADYDALCAALLDGGPGSGGNFSPEPCPACPPTLDSAPPSRHSSG